MRAAVRATAGAFLLASALAAAQEPRDEALHAIFEREFQLDLEEHPERATRLGIEGYDDRLTDRSPAAVERRKAHLAKVIEELARFDASRLGTQDRISRDILLADLRLRAEEDAFYKGLPFGSDGDGWLPVSPMHGPQAFYPFLAKATRLRGARDYENYLKRLAAIPRALEQTTQAMRAGMRSGWMPPRAALGKVPGMFAPFAGPDVTATPLWQPFEKFPPEMSAQERSRFTEAGRRVLAEKVHPAFAAMKRFIEAEYVPAARSDLAASTLPGGAAYYALRVRSQTTTTLTAAQIHDTGKREVARIRAEMDRVIRAAGFAGTFAEFVAFVNSDPRFFFAKPEQRLAAYRDIAKRVDPELPRLFAELPRIPYGVRAMEAYEGDNADHYSPPALDGSRAGYFEANVNNLHKRPSYTMESFLLHEAVPGHHLQNARALELKGLPRFRRLGRYVAYGEGWALYAESLGHELGMYRDPYAHFGALTAEMLRACRLVVDTGMHALGWGREQSIRYLVENAGIHPDFAAAEVDRYIVWPGQALGYKVGELRIKALRARARAALGERFDLRRFHNALLDDGPLPLTLLEARIDEWIAAEKEKP